MMTKLVSMVDSEEGMVYLVDSDNLINVYINYYAVEPLVEELIG